MIVVIADDITGAAEIAGLGLQHGLVVEMSLSVDKDTRADMLVIATDARSMPQAQAVASIKEVTAQVAPLQPAFIYKKTDSVLRGHVLAEVKEQMQVLGKPKALIIPANPSMGRTIAEGEYHINNTPIHQTGFAYDPEFPATSSLVTHILRAGEQEVKLCKTGDRLTTDGIFVANTATAADLQYWVKNAGADTLIAGGAGFFTEWMNLHHPVKEPAHYPAESPLGNKILYVCGTAFTQTHEKIDHQHRTKENVCYMPEEVALSAITDESGITDWTEKIVGKLTNTRQLIVAIPQNFSNGKPDAAALRKKMAVAVSAVLDRAHIGELLIEGGSSGFAILQQLQLSRFVPVQLLAPGVLRLRSEERPGLFLTLKPGSYHWPDYIWQH